MATIFSVKSRHYRCVVIYSYAREAKQFCSIDPQPRRRPPPPHPSCQLLPFELCSLPLAFEQVSMLRLLSAFTYIRPNERIGERRWGKGKKPLSEFIIKYSNKSIIIRLLLFLLLIFIVCVSFSFVISGSLFAAVLSFHRLPWSAALVGFFATTTQSFVSKINYNSRPCYNQRDGIYRKLIQ